MAGKDAMRFGMLVVASAAAALTLAATAGAATFKVTKKGDPVPGSCTASDCSLREAVRKANNRNGADKIVLPGKGPYDLSQPGAGDEYGEEGGDLDITDDRVTIVHPGRGKATVDANEIDRVFEVFEDAAATFNKLVIRDGVNADDSSEGGGIHTSGSLKVVRSKITGNESEQYGGGIGMNDPGSLQLIRSTVSGNVADSDGGAIDGGQRRISIVNSRITGNEGGGDGALYLYGDVVIKNSTLSNNVVDAGGAIRWSQSGERTLRITGSTISGNRSNETGGGIAAFGGLLQISNSTIAGNTTDGLGGGIFVNNEDADVRLNATTIAYNRADAEDGDDSGGGLFLAEGEVSVENSVIASNSSTDDAPDDCTGSSPIDSRGHNLLSVECDGFDAGSDLVTDDPRIGPLGANGGPTQTVPLRAGSDAIGHAKRSSAPNRDQRGEKRDRRPDAGAFER
jgi:hypothetical protein